MSKQRAGLEEEQKEKKANLRIVALSGESLNSPRRVYSRTRRYSVAYGDSSNRGEVVGSTWM
jgi:hypothetical protein